MKNLIQNDWLPGAALGSERALILQADQTPEGVRVERLRVVRPANLTMASDAGHLLSVLAGRATLRCAGLSACALDRGTHIYLPPGAEATLEAEAGSAFVHVAGERTRGSRVLLRHERFVRATATETQALRWTFTPQYLSRRIFLHHDATLLSANGSPLSWFHTTMFDVRGLGANAEGEPVFKMSYNSRTEFNVCYDVHGEARVRLALHPYALGAAQRWQPWQRLDSDSTYCLAETSGGPDEEVTTDPESAERRTLRNKHEVYAMNGHVSLLCAFDPAPAGVERHAPGEYSDYEPLERVEKTDAYKQHQAAIAPFDAMVDALSMARAQGRAIESLDEYALFERGEAAQSRLEDGLLQTIALNDPGRAEILRSWAGDATGRPSS